MILLLFLLEVLFSEVYTYDARPTVNLKEGKIIGIKVYPDVPRMAINTFLGIPYAEPPEGELRFSIPKRHRGWNNTLYAGNYKPVCPFRTTSYNSNENEDCLYLNIWTPDSAYGPKLPVIVFFESEELFGIESNTIRIPGHDLAAEGAVVVSVNYRQNIFGFFCLSSSEARGNLGLLDQYLSLLWIKENISQFGGNSNLVTLLGHSSSAVAILYHLISPKTTDLFARAIIMSGSATLPSFPIDPIRVSLKLTEDLGCSMMSQTATMDCLRSKSVQEILRNFDRQIEAGYDNICYRSIMPVADTFLPEQERYLPLSIETALVNGSFLSIPILTGITDFLSNSEQWKWSDLNQDFSQLSQYAEELVIPKIFKKYNINGSNVEAIKDIIRWKYLWSKDNDARILAESIHKFQWDALHAAPYNKQLQLLANSSKAGVYAYFLHSLESLMNISRSTVGGDLLLLFGPVLLQQIARRRFNVPENKLSKQLKTLWINFARYGIPSTGSYRDNWLPYSNASKYSKYLGNKWNKQDYEYGVNLWNILLPRFIKINNPVNTIPKELQYSLDPAAGFRNAMYTLVGLVIALLALLLVCVVLLKRREKEKSRHMGF